MTEEKFREQRAELVKQFWFLKSKRCYLAAKARIRAIARLDLEYKGIPIDTTHNKFGYDKIKSKE